MCVPHSGDDCRVVRLGGGQAQQPDRRIQMKISIFSIQIFVKLNAEFTFVRVPLLCYLCVFSRGVGGHWISLNCRATENVEVHDLNFHALVMNRSRKGKADDDICKNTQNFLFKSCLWRIFVALARRGTSSRARNPRRSPPPAAVASTTASVISGTTRSRIDTAKNGQVMIY